ncbi:hypothetical protein KVA01_02730 [Kocuria varians]|uniref:Uncharacterized protein n=1 Tax=Kocuria varians TaxID=1272 RepID=A0A4Y4CYV1_KOCVA|nr:hypothetical protein KVA01_02730 [Kocuria varians]
MGALPFTGRVPRAARAVPSAALRTASSVACADDAAGLGDAVALGDAVPPLEVGAVADGGALAAGGVVGPSAGAEHPDSTSARARAPRVMLRAGTVRGEDRVGPRSWWRRRRGERQRAPHPAGCGALLRCAR